MALVGFPPPDYGGPAELAVQAPAMRAQRRAMPPGVSGVVGAAVHRCLAGNCVSVSHRREVTMKPTLRFVGQMALVAGLVLPAMPARAASERDCSGLPTWAQLQAALKSAVAAETSGLNNQMWGTIVNRDGVVCAVAFSGGDRSGQWPGSRVISAQ